MSKVIQVDFAPSAPRPKEHSEVSRLVHRASVILGQHSGQVIRTRIGERISSAFVSGTEYRLGVTVGVYSSLRCRPQDEPIRAWLDRKDIAPKFIGMDLTADAEWLLDGELAMAGSFGCEFANPDVASIEEVSSWLRANCRRYPLDRVTREDILRWKQTVVTIPGSDSKPSAVTLHDAVKVYGPIYYKTISPEKLASNHNISMMDAVTIAHAVRQLLTKKRAT